MIVTGHQILMLIGIYELQVISDSLSLALPLLESCLVINAISIRCFILLPRALVLVGLFIISYLIKYYIYNTTACERHRVVKFSFLSEKLYNVYYKKHKDLALVPNISGFYLCFMR